MIFQRSSPLRNRSPKTMSLFRESSPTSTPPSLLDLCCNTIAFDLHIFSSLVGIPDFLADNILSIYHSRLKTYTTAIDDDSLPRILSIETDLRDRRTGSNLGLIHLSLRWSRITHHSAPTISDHCPNLISLDLSYSDVGDDAVSEVVRNCPHLTSLAVTGCSAVSDRALSTIALHASRLESLSLGLCAKITDRGVQTIARKLKRLRELSLAACSAVTNVGVSIVCEQLGAVLESLDLSGLKNLTDFDTEDVARHCLALRHLNVRSCWRATDASARHLAKLCRRKRKRNCPLFESIDLGGCRRMTDKGMVSLLRAAGADLRVLDLRGLARITDETLVAAGASCSGLRSLVLLGCEGVSEEGVEALRVALGPGLKYVMSRGSRAEQKS